jgi:hypothetical protein
MITAQQAREKMHNKPVANMEELYNWIEKRASMGYDFTFLDDKSLTNNQIKELETNGFKVKQSEIDYKISW